MKTVGILFQPKKSEAVDLAGDLAHAVERNGARAWSCSAWDEAGARQRAAGTDFVVTLGGDGTVLRAARLFAPQSIPVVGVNLGRLGFMTELDPTCATTQIGAFLRDEAWVEERLMLQASITRGPNASRVSSLQSPVSTWDPDPETRNPEGEPATYHVLNDVVVARGAVSRMIRVRTSVDGATLTSYAVDAVIVATPSGSTAYSFAAGGPILHPEMENILVTPVCAHLTLARPLVLAASVHIALQVSTDHEAGLNIDGQVEIPLWSGDTVEVTRSPYRARFLRIQPRTYFYSTMTRRLKLE